MSRVLRITLAMLAPTVLVILFAVATDKPGPPGQAETLLQDYLRYRDSTSQPTTVQQIVEANRPGSLTPQMSQATFGNTMFQMTVIDPELNNVTPFPAVTPLPGEFSTGSIPIPTVTPLAGEFSLDRFNSPSDGDRTGVSSGPVLPFPPAEAWCVVVRRVDQALPGLVFLARHQDDLYRMAWVVHESTAQTLPELNASLAAVGCDVTLQP